MHLQWLITFLVCQTPSKAALPDQLWLWMSIAAAAAAAAAWFQLLCTKQHLNQHDTVKTTSRIFQYQWTDNMAKELERLRGSWNQQMLQMKWIWKCKGVLAALFFSYLRMINTDQRIHCCFLVGKVSETKQVCIDSSPRTDCSSTVSRSGKFPEERVENWLLSWNILVQ